jgi:hypothetical protein
MSSQTWILFVVGIAVLSIGTAATAQPIPPPFGGPPSLFDPEPGVVESGVVLDAQAVVSADRKYVTINARFGQSQLVSLVPFPVNGGFVGGFNPGGGGGGGGGGPGGFSASVLEKPGMHKIAPLLPSKPVRSVQSGQVPSFR